MLIDISRESEKLILQMNMSKTKLMTKAEASLLRIDNAPVEYVKECVFGAIGVCGKRHGQSNKKEDSSGLGQIPQLMLNTKDKSLSEKLSLMS